MIKLSVLFAVNTFPTKNDNYNDDANPNIVGLAEWFLNIPNLFLLLLGKDAKAAPFAVYGEAGTNKALVLETLKAQQRWQVFYALACQQKPAINSAALMAQLAIINDLLMATKHAYLALDIWSSVTENNQAKKAYNAHVESLLKQAALLDDALANSTPSQLTEPILAILENSQHQLGYWSKAVIARQFEIEREDIAHIPLLADYQEYENENPSWLYHIPAYIVHKKGSAERAPIGVVTPYGRWLVPLLLGTTAVDDLYTEQQASNFGWIKCEAVEYDNKLNCTSLKSVLFDINGNQATAILQNTALFVHSATVGSIYRNYLQNGEQADIVNLPDLTVILADVSGVDYGEDGYIRFRKNINVRDGKPCEETLIGLMQEDGKLLVHADTYFAIGEFHKTKQIAIVSKHKPDFAYDENKNSEENIGHLQGLIDQTGKLIIACKYLYLLPINGENRIKVHQKDRVLLMGTDKKLTIYKTNGELVAATQYEVPGQLIYLGGYLQDDLITVTDGENVMQMDFDGVASAAQLSLEAFMDEVLQPFRNIKEKLSQAKKQKYHTITAQTIFKENRWSELAILCTCACLNDIVAAEKVCADIKTHILSEDYAAENWSIATDLPTLHVTVRLALMDILESGFGARIDWKDSDTLAALANMAPMVAALKGFKWSAADNADSMIDGIAAAAQYVQKSNVNLFTLPADGDLYEIGFVRDADMQTLQALTVSVGIHLNFDW